MDVAVDLRTDSKTFGQVFSIILTDNDHNSIFIPEGFAHGFQTLSENVEMLYFTATIIHQPTRLASMLSIPC